MRDPNRDLTLKIAILNSRHTQRQISRRLRIEESRLSRIVNREVEAEPREQKKLAKFLGRDVPELFPPEAAA